MKKRNLFRTSIIAIISFILILACSNFMEDDEDFIKNIEKDVTEANAPQLTINIRAANDNMGVTSPLGSYTVKKGIPFEITTTVSNKYSFLKWTQTGGNGDEVVFDDASSITTKATVNSTISGISLMPVFDSKPEVSTWLPYSGSQNILINRSITIAFSEPIDSDSISLSETGSIQITTVKTANISTSTPTHVENQFNYSLEGGALTLSLKSGEYHEKFSTIAISISREITDISGNQMADDFSWFFQTGSGRDEEPPTISSFKVNEYNESPGYSKDLQLELTADDQSVVSRMIVVVTPWSTGDPSGTAEGPEVSTGEIDFEPDYTLSLTGLSDGWYKIRVNAADTSDNWSTSDPEDVTSDGELNTKYVYLDRVAPSASQLNIASSEFTNQATSSVTVTTPNGTGSSINGYKLSTSASTPSAWDSTMPATISLSNGYNTYYLHLKDQAGNTAYISDTITLDQNDPTVSSFSIGSSEVTSQANVSVNTGSISGTGSNIAGYKLTASTATPSSWDSTIPATVMLTSGSNTLYLHVKDEAGNTAFISDSITLDQIPPSASLALGSSEFVNASNVSVNISSLDGTGSSVIGYKITTTTTTPSSWDSAQPNTVSLSNGLNTIYLHLRDEAGNTGYTSDTITYDDSDPTIASFSIGSSELTNVSPSNISTGTIDGTGSPVVGYKITNSSGTPSTWDSTLPTTVVLSTGLQTYYLHVKDQAGNTGYISDSIKYDGADPTISSFTIGSSDYTNQSNVSLNIGTISGTGSDVVGYKLTTTTTIPSFWDSTLPVSATLTNGLNTFYLHVKDEAGNTTYTSDSITLDQVDPSASLALGSSEFVSSSTVTVGISSLNGTGSSVVGYKLTTTSATPSAWDSSQPATVSLSSGLNTVYLHLKDEAGNTGYTFDTITFDNIDPTIASFTLGSSELTNLSIVSVNTGSIDGTGSSVNGYKITNSSSTPSSWDSILPSTVNLSTGLQTYYLHIKDEAGNTNYISDSIKYDGSDPTISSFTVGSSEITNQATVSVNAGSIDGTGSSIDGYKITTSAVTPSSWDSSLPASVTLSSGLNTLYLHVKDEAGNTTYIYDTITLDQAAPTAVLTLGSSEYINSSSVSVNITSLDGTGSSVIKYKLTSSPSTPFFWDSSQPSTAYLSSGMNTFYLHMKDEAGNTGYTSDSITYDSSDPTIASFSIGSSELTNVSPESVNAGSIDGTGSPVVGYKITTTSSTPSTWDSTLPTTVSLVTGPERYYLHIKDEAGNTNYISDTIKYDGALPTIASFTLGSSEFTDQSSVSVNTGTIDGTGSSIVGYKITSTSSTPSTWDSSLQGAVSLSSGLNTFYLHVKDEAGNTEYAIDTITLDQSEPTATLALGGSEFVNISPISVNLSSLNGTGSSITGYKLTTTTATPSSWDSTPPSSTSLTFGFNTIYLHLKDEAGNTGYASDTITYDGMVPTISSITLGSSETTTDASVSLSVGIVNGTGSNIDGYKLTTTADIPGSWDAVPPATADLILGLNTFYLHIKDEAGNTAYAIDTITRN